MKKVLVADRIASEGIDLLSQVCEVTVRLDLAPTELVQIIAEYDALLVRSATKVTAEVLKAGRHLAVVGRAGTGVDNVDLEAATRLGIMVVNAPTSNTVAVAEHTIGLMLCMARHLADANNGMHQGLWQKNALMGSELRGKVLGLVGLGKVGAAVAQRARGLEMQLIAFDPFVSPERAQQLGAELVTLDELLFRSDYVSLHAPATERTQGMIGKHELSLMKPTARLINCARGDLIVEQDLMQALREGSIAGAALDVFVGEPNVAMDWRDCPNVLLTPHLAASTEEAQSGAALEVARQVIDVLEGRGAKYPVNAPALSSDELRFLLPYAELARRMGRFYAQMAESNLTRLEVTYAGELAPHDVTPLTAAILSGLLSEISDIPVNPVNAPLIARERGLTVNEVRTSAEQDDGGQIILRAETTGRERTLAGVVTRGQAHIVRVDDFGFDFAPEGRLLVSEHIEQPGVLGQVGTLLGKKGINISFVQVGRQNRGGPGMMVLGLDDDLDEEALTTVRCMGSVRAAWVVAL